jgi:hypothetical protein
MAGNMWMIYSRENYCRSEFVGVRGGPINMNGSKSCILTSASSILLPYFEIATARCKNAKYLRNVCPSVRMAKGKSEPLRVVTQCCNAYTSEVVDCIPSNAQRSLESLIIGNT